MMRQFRWIWMVAFVLGMSLSSGSLAAQDNDDTVNALKKIVDEPNSAAKLDHIADVVQKDPDSFKGDDGRKVRAAYINIVFDIWPTPDKAKEITGALDKIIAASPEQDRDDANREAAQALADRGLLLADAERYAQQGLKLSNAFTEATLKELQHQADLTKSAFLATLGQVYFKAGDLGNAKDTLSQAHAIDPTDNDVVTTLAKIAFQQGDYTTALNDMTPVMLAGGVSADDRKLFTDAYSKTHGNATAGIEQFLDQEYLKSFKSPITVQKYTGTTKSSKTVLLELFGSATCGPCMAADLATDAELQRYAPGQMVLLVYHENIPDPDPMTNPETEARGDYYDIDRTPTAYIDGAKVEHTGGGSSDAVGVYEKLAKGIDERLNEPTTARVQLVGSLTGNNVSGTVTVSGIPPATANIAIQVALVEDVVRFSGGNGIRFHHMVVRDIANGGKGFIYKGIDNQSNDFSFDLTNRDQALKTYLTNEEQTADDPFTFDDLLLPINSRDLSLVAFVQNTKTKEILQAQLLAISDAAEFPKVADDRR